MSRQTNGSLRRTVRIAGALGAVVLAISLFAVWQFEAQIRDEARESAKSYITTIQANSNANDSHFAGPTDVPFFLLNTLHSNVAHYRVTPKAETWKPATRTSLRYRVTDIGVCPDMEPTTAALNNRGDALITLGQKAYLWHRGRRTCLDSDGFSVVALNDARDCVGGSEFAGRGAMNEYYDDEAMIWRHGAAGAMIDMIDGQAVDVNDRGQVLCESKPDDETPFGDPDYGDAFIWRNGDLQDLGASLGRAINNRGQVAGQLRDNRRAALWDGHGWADLGALLGTKESFAKDINERGDVIGEAPGTFDSVHAVWSQTEALLWRASGRKRYQMIDLGLGSPRGINNAGEIVGGRNGEPVMWRKGRIIDLGRCIGRRTGWTLVSAEGINNRGQIIGYAKRHGVDHIVLLTPTVTGPGVKRTWGWR